MASKRSRKKRAPKKSKKSPFRQILKIPIGLAILTILVLMAGVLTHQIIVKRRPVRLTGSDVENIHPSMPNLQFEIYPQNVPPPPKESKPRKTPPTDRVPRVALILDDIGYDRAIVKKFLELDLSLTLSMLPKSPFKKSIVAEARKHHTEIMLHQPMEPFEFPRIKPGPGSLLSSMTPDELVEQFVQNLDAMPFVSGVNNHMGSKMTANAAQMRQIFSILKKRKLFFIDSRTTEKTICRPSAALLQIPFGERDIFIDHVLDDAFIQKQLYELVRIAKTHGEAIGIAHPHRKTLKILQAVVPDLKKEVRFVPASEVARISG